MRVLVVDDSALMRRWLTECFSAEADIEVQTARDGADALAKIATFAPDVVTLDVNMPAMDGLTCLSRIMTEAPRPVVMLSSLTETGAMVTLEALELGAVDYIAKPDGTVSRDLKRIFPDILAKVRAAARARIRRPRLAATARAPVLRRHAGERLSAAAQAEAPADSRFDLVLIGASTGGPRALEDVLLPLDAGFPVPIVIAQHMPRRFTGVFARRLGEQAAIEVVEVTGTTELLPGRAHLARGDADIVVSRRGTKLVAASVPPDPERVWTPSVDRMVESALKVVPAARLACVLLTGMGNDGAASMTQVRRGGGRTIAESEETAAIFGMPRELAAMDGAERVLGSDRIAAALTQMVRLREVS